ncbi:MAG: hypothetical protein A2161_11070 [Candidatus Schekmanbacteria bacterium RBG_13_48_7]|uniref:Uncharacterized protein n=1 Tax=Candidatus Schekmanbacteria bacterium RBG_13_48_7 TaxID=1817878 RepID=A0A1F7RSS8_9BACT|nr:MAG: hypothetical protein A2161_11070 [Candidatus Schekmanbacteria bacterium RBG_13_48_7]
MKKRKRIEELIESLFEAINISTNDSPFVQEILREIEESGFEIQMRFIIGVVPSLSPAEKKDPKSVSKMKRKRVSTHKKVRPRLTQKDKEFLDSLGLNL